jgi:preprotein translocase subunit YajC
VFLSFFLLQQQAQTPNLIAQALPFVLIAVVFYFLLFMPMQRQKKRQQQMVNALKAGDTVLTSGGIMGTVTAVDGDTIVLRVKPDNLKLQFARSAVSTVVNPEGSK